MRISRTSPDSTRPEQAPDQHRTKRQKRPRAIQACELCRKMKNKCDEVYPCTLCTRRNVECVYRNPNFSRNIQSSDREFQAEGPRKQTPRSDIIAQGTPSNNEYRESLHDISQTRPQDLGLSHGSGYSRAPIVSQQRSDRTRLEQDAQGGIDNDTMKPDRDDVSETTEGLTDMNLHTKSIEFHGSSSSMAFLRHVQTNCDDAEGVCRPSLVSMLHNTAFLPASSLPSNTSTEDMRPNKERFYFRVSTKFIEEYFLSIHYVQPFLEREDFMTRCEDLWFETQKAEDYSFHALYYSILSFGALIGVWDVETLYGLNRFQWSRKLFDEARVVLARLGTTTNLEMVQCLLIMGKICQHELNPHVAYMYVGMSVRTALAIGLNREPSSKFSQEDPAYSKAAWKTWWLLYALESQTSFALGRPDTLGDDRYHNRHYPSHTLVQGRTPDAGPGEIDTPDLAIIPAMVEFSRITRQVYLDIYLTKSALSDKLVQAKHIESELDSWMERRFIHLQTTDESKPLSSPKWAKESRTLKRQQLILRIRYHNLRMLLYSSSLTVSISGRKSRSPLFAKGVEKCIDSATKTIELIYETYRVDSFFQTWWYNTTYTLFAVTILLITIFQYDPQHCSCFSPPYFFLTIEKAVEILEAMDQCLVAKNACAIIKRTLARAREHSAPRSSTTGPTSFHSSVNEKVWPQPNTPLQYTTTGADEIAEIGQMGPAGLTSGSDIPDVLGDAAFSLDLAALMDDGGQALFWVDWENSLNALG